MTREDPEDEDFAYIADIRLTSNLKRSKFGDERLFFRHETFSRDTANIKRHRNRYTHKEAKAKAKRWQDAVERINKNITENIWGDTPINPLPEDRDEAQQIIMDGIIE